MKKMQINMMRMVDCDTQLSNRNDKYTNKTRVKVGLD